ncbi:MAG TPA: TetR/AcrR family transcriptional regulator [Rhodocyclaceae bacterium]|nr:TetR/AcrR family transcriptional regulator [Rhodocyclaceae bacterium]
MVKALVSSPETTGRILDAAERLFMEHGYDGASMRMLTTAAGVNLAAINYHFGSKEGLMQAVFKRRLAWLNGERLRVLDALEQKAAGKPLRPSQVLEAFFGTLLTMGERPELGGMVFLRLIGRTLTEPAHFIRDFFAGEYLQVVERYKAALYRALPDVPQDEISWRFQFMLGAMSYSIAGTDSLRVLGGISLADDSDAIYARRLRERLMPFLLGGLRAPLPEFSEQPPGRAAAKLRGNQHSSINK